MHFVVSQQVRALEKNVEELYREVIWPLWGAIAAGLIILLASPNRPTTIRGIAANWFLLIPTAAALGLYACVHVESRYVAPFVVVLTLAAFSRMQLPDDRRSRRLMASAAVAAAISLGSLVVASTLHRLIQWSNERPVYWEAAAALARMGVHPGDKVATIGGGPSDAAWARLAEARIVAEVPTDEQDSFWAASNETREKVFAALRRADVRAIVADEDPACSLSAWDKLGDTKYRVHILPK